MSKTFTHGGVILDATATSSIVYELLDSMNLWEPPAQCRSYKNVTLHVNRGNRVGKDYMSKNAKALCKHLISYLNIRLAWREVLIVCHKDVEPLILSYQATFKLYTAHWGAVVGSNHWRGCDTAVIFGLPYPPPNWSANRYMASKGPQDTAWLRSGDKRSYGNYPDIRKALEYGKIATDVLQAINRIRCRNVIDSEGNCLPADVYLLLPNDKLADAIIEQIRIQMPGIQISHDWDYDCQNRAPKKSKSEEALAKYILNMPPGSKHSKRTVCESLGIASKTFDRLMKKRADATSIICDALSKANVEYRVGGKGRNDISYLARQ